MSKLNVDDFMSNEETAQSSSSTGLASATPDINFGNWWFNAL